MDHANPHSSQDASLRPGADIVARRLDRAGVLVHLPTNRIYELNETGIRIWELLGEGHGVEGVLGHLVEEFDVDRDHAAAELSAFLDRFRHEGLVGS